MNRILHAEFRDENRDSRYPFSDAATLTAGSLEIPHETFIDASVYPIGGGERLCISKVDVESREVTLWIGDATQTELASGSFDPLAPDDVILLADSYGRPAGMLLSDASRLAIFQTWPLGTHALGPGAAEFAAAVTIPTPEVGVRGIATEDGELLTGDVWFVGEDGIVVREEDGHIRVDIVGDPLFERRLCRPFEQFSTPNFLRTINHIPPDENGNFQLTAGDNLASDTVLRIYPRDNELVIEVVGQPLDGFD